MNLKLKLWIDGKIGRVLATINVVLVRGVGLLLNRNHNIKNAPQNILVIKMLGLGSVFMASDSLFSLKKTYPNSKLILMCGKGVAAGIEPLKLFDEIWVHNDKNIFALVGSGIKLLTKCWRLKKLWVVDLEVYSVLTTLFSAYTLAINRFGFELNKVHFRNYLNTHNIYFNQFITINQNYHNLVAAMGVVNFYNFSFFVEPNTEFTQKNYIAINNTCSDLCGNLRKLPENLLAEICTELLNTTNNCLAFTGSPTDFTTNQHFIDKHLTKYTNRVKNIAGTQSFNQYYSFLQHNCVAMLSIDSAPLHIAIKLGLPTLSFWGPIKPSQCYNFENQTKHLHYYLQTACSPCIHLTEVVPCGGNNICMKNMQIQIVKPLLQNLLNQTAC